jgi:hypothetical protein
MFGVRVCRVVRSKIASRAKCAPTRARATERPSVRAPGRINDLPYLSPLSLAFSPNHLCNLSRFQNPKRLPFLTLFTFVLYYLRTTHAQESIFPVRFPAVDIFLRPRAFRCVRHHLIALYIIEFIDKIVAAYA